ncbi:MAG: leucine-rich repeat protein [Faecousia sp.]
MMKDLVARADAYLTPYRRKKIQKGVVRVLAFAVVCSIVYALMLPAITMETETYCGYQEHQHDASCYSEQLICELPESPEDGHVHEETCYEETLICEMEEHTHSLDCYSNPNADVETAAEWEQTLPGRLSGKWASDLIAVAKSQIGYAESESNYRAGENGDINGYTRYGAWYGDPYGDWNAMFVSFCLNYAKIPQSDFPREASCAAWINTLEACSLFRSASDYEPAVGDLVFLDTNGDNASDRVGLVAQFENTLAQIKTIEGDVSGCVSTVTYSLPDERIVGYAQLPENPDAVPVETTSETTEPEETTEPKETTAETTEPEATAAETTEPVESTSEETSSGNEALSRPMLLSAGGGAAVYASDPELFEGHEYLEIQNNQIVSVNIGTRSDKNYFRFTPTVTHRYAFSVDSEKYVYCYLYNSSGDYIEYSGGYNFSLTYTLQAGETYYFGAGFSSYETGSFRATLTYGAHGTGPFGEDGICDCGVSAPDIKLDTLMPASITTAGSYQFFRFQPTVTHAYTFESTGDYNTYGYLYDADGNLIASSSYGGSGSNFRLSYTLQAGEIYYLGAKFSSSITGSFDVILTYKLDSHSFEDGKCSCGKVPPALTLNEPAPVNITLGGGFEYFQFQPEITHSYAFESTGDYNAYGYLYDADGNQLTSTSGKNFRLTCNLTAGTTYYFGVKLSDTNATGSFSATLSYFAHSYNAEQVCTCGAVRVKPDLQTGDPITVYIGSGGGVDYFRFTPTVTHYYTFESKSSSDTYCTLYDADMKALTSNDDGGEGYNFKITYKLEAGRTYYFGARYYSSSSAGSYSATLYYDNHSFSSGACTCGGTPEPITRDVPASVNIDVPGEWAFYSFKPAVTHDYTFESTGECNTYGYLYSSGGAQLTYSTSGGSGNNFKLTYTLSADTTYYLGVRLSDTSSTGTFGVVSTYGTEHHTFTGGVCVCGASASAIGLNTATDVKIDTAGKWVYFSFTPAQTHYYVLESTGSYNTYGYLYDASGAQLAYSSSGGRGSNFRLEYSLYANTTYYFGVRLYDTSSTGEFNVYLTYSPYRHSFDTEGTCVCSGAAAPVALNEPKSVKIEGPGEWTYYSFTPEVTHQYVFESTGECDTYGYLYSSSGARLTYSSSGGSGNNFKLTYTLTAGVTYYFGAGLRYPDNTGEFTVSLSYGTWNHAFDAEDGQCPCGVSAAVMQVGQTVPVTFKAPGSRAFYRFTPTVSHAYVFQASNSDYAYGYLYDANWKQINYSGSSSNLVLNCTLTAGNTYYWVTYYSSSYDTSSYTTVVNFGAHSYDESGICSDCGRMDNSCGDQASYSFEDGVLTIRGSSVTDSYNSSNFRPPWYDIRDQITSVVVEDGITGLGDYLFSNCTNLQSVSIADSVESIGNNAFSSCTALTSATIPNSVKSIESYAFSSCTGLTSVTIPDSVERIGDWAFASCTGLTSVTIPGSVKSFGDYAFYHCTGLKNLELSDGLSSIGSHAFYYCTGLTSVTIPGSVKSIGDSAFYYCTGLTSAEFSGGVTDTGNGTFSNCSNLVSVIIPDTVTRIGNNAFYNCTRLVTAVIPESVTVIGERAFYNCSKLTPVVIPDSVTTIGKEAFYNCKGLTSALIPAGATSIDDYAFYGSGITSVTIPDTVTRIGDYAFYNCTALTEIAIPESVSSIGRYALSGCTGLTALEIPDTVTEIGDYAFRGCTGLTSFRIPEGFTGLPNGMLSDCTGLTSVMIPEDVTTIGDNAFYECRNLASVTIPEGVTSIGSSAFYNCTGLTSIIIPEGVTSIGNSAFSGCTGLTSILIPEGVTSIGNYAFSSCSGLTSVTIPEGVTSIGSGAFYNCTGLTSIIIPEGVTSIGGSAFSRCIGLTSVTIPESVTTIGASAFYECLNLTSVTVPDGVTSISDCTFKNCSNLIHVTIPEGVQSIGTEAFFGCSKLVSPALPSTLTSIGKSAFMYCDSITSLTIPQGVTSIGEQVFYSCDGITSLAIPQGITSIGEQAFCHCSNLTYLTFPDSLTRIGNSAFAYCYNLSEIMLPENLRDLGNSAFAYCSKVESIRLNTRNLDIGYSSWASSLSGVSSLTIGNGVDVVSESFLTQLGSVSADVRKILFEKENHFTLADSWPATWSLPLPVSRMTAGEYYVDNSGVLFRLNADNTATLFYVPDGLGMYSVPAVIPAGNGAGPWTVTAVEAGSLRQASLSAISFAVPGSIRTIPADGLGSCPTLLSVNGYMTVPDAAGSFTNPDAEIDSLAFYGSGLQDAAWPETVNAEFTIAVPSSEDEPAILARITTTAKADGNEKYAYLTGEQATANLSVQGLNLSEPDYRYVRFYFAFDREKHNMSMKPGEYTNDGYPYSILETAVAGTYCVRVPIVKDETFQLAIDSLYYNAISSGGTLRLWAVALTQEEDAALASGIRFASRCQQVTWNVQPQSLAVQKTQYTGSNIPAPKFLGDGTMDGTVYLQNLRYKISAARDTSGDMGKDIIQSIDYSDTMTLPEGIHLRDGLADAIRAGRYDVSYAYYSSYGSYYQINVKLEGQEYPLAGIRWLSGSTTYLRLCDWKADIDNVGNLVFQWTVENSAASRATSTSEDIAAHTVEVFFGNQIFVADKDTLSAERSYEICNSVSAEEHFTYSVSQTETEEYTHTVSAAAPDFTVTNSYSGWGYWGYGNGSDQDLHVHITLNNPTPFAYEGIYQIYNPLDSYCYIPAIKMEKMIQQVRSGDVKCVDTLSFTITYATFCKPGGDSHTPGSQVIGTNGKTYTLTQANAGVGTSYDGMVSQDDAMLNKSAWNANDKITIVYDTRTDSTALTYQYTDKDGNTVSGSLENITDIGATLEGIGYLVTRNSWYTVAWNLDKDCVLYSNESAVYDLYFAYKDSFMFYQGDREYVDTSSNYYYITNTARAYYGESQENKYRSASYDWDYVHWDWSLSLSASSGGEALSNGSTVAAGDVIDYTIRAYKRSSTGVYDIAPLVEHLEGPQLLLAPVSANEAALQGEGADIYTAADGKAYYLLTVPDGETSHTYRGVTLGGKLTDSITVTQKTDGLEYLIRWYLTDFNTGNDVTASLNYQTLFDPDRITMSGVSGANFQFDSECWLNDHESHRLYDTLKLKGMLLRLDKSIVTEQGSDPEEDKLTDRSVIREANTVTYRIMLEAVKSDVPVTITGEDIRDALPAATNDFFWSKDNVKVSYSSDVKIEGGSGKDWSITGSAPSQSITWDSGLKLTFTDRMYIYITLTYPKGEAWESYTGQIRGGRLENRFYLQSISDAVYHDLCAEAKAYLQKGVYSTSAYSYSYRNSDADSRLLYNNSDMEERYVEYYVVLYNGGNTRLYVDTIQDVLPAGFKYYSSSYSSNRPTLYDANGNVINPSWKSVSVNAGTPQTTASGQQRLTFTLSGSTDTRYIQSDPILDKYYLAPGEAICFLYSCRIGAYGATEDTAVNTVAIPYFDYNEGGVKLADVSAVGADRDDGKITAKNDGSCEIKATPWANSTGFAGGDLKTSWLASDVSMMRGMIQPGISVDVESITRQVDNMVVTDPQYSGLQDTINWAVTAYSGGNAAIHDYTLTDVIQSPYSFTGAVKFSTEYGSNYPQTTYFTRISNATLFTIGERAKDNLNTITLSYLTKDGTVTSTIQRGEELTFTHSSYGNITVKVYVNADGNEAISVRLHGDNLAIPEGGSATLTVSTANVTGVYSHKDFYNSAYITPEQPFDSNSITRGRFAQLDGRDSVRSSSQIFVAYGHVVTYSQRIEELNDSSNYATSADLDYNYILLPDSRDVFRYTLKMENLTQNEVNKLVLIDSLAQVGDHNVFTSEELRNSDFWIRLADNPDIEITVAGQTLDPGTYTLEYSGKTDFTEDDWNGTASESWRSECGTDTRSFRIVIGDETAPVVGPNQILQVSFNGQILMKSEAETMENPIFANVKDPIFGQTAWNGFGIHFHVGNDSTYMDASPLIVGVRVPGVPVLQTKLTSKSDGEVLADHDITSRFLIYSGEEIGGLTNAASEEEMNNLLSQNGRTCTYAERTVEAGKNLSEELYLTDYRVCAYNAGKWKETETPWIWEETEKYTVLELPSTEEAKPEYDQYVFYTLGGVPRNSYTFTYTRSLNQWITAIDIRKEWNLQINKTDAGTTQPLPGAWFAIYSPLGADQMNADDIPDALTETPSDSLSHEKWTYYLMDIQQSGDDGTIVWENLAKGSYLTVELQAPDGYYVDSTVHFISGDDVPLGGTEFVNAANLTGFELPKTGGAGITAFYVLGFILTAGTAMLLIVKKRVSVKR